MELKPIRYADESLSFMFETCLMLRTTKFVMDDKIKLDHDYFLVIVCEILIIYGFYSSVGKS